MSLLFCFINSSVALISLGVYFSSMMKVWINWANIVELSLGYKSNRSPSKRGARFGPGWVYKISLMELGVMVKRTFWS